MMHFFNDAHLNVAHCVFYFCTNNVPLVIGSPQITFTFSKSEIETLEKGVKYIPN